MAHTLDAVRIGEVYKIDGFNYKLLAAVMKIRISSSSWQLWQHMPHAGHESRVRISGQHHKKKKPTRHATPWQTKSIKRLKLKLTEREILDRAAQSLENAIGRRTECNGHGGISICVAAKHLRTATT